MAEFNASGGVDGAEDFTGRSRGFTSSLTPFAGLFKDVGEVGLAAVGIADQNNLQNQQRYIQEGVDQTLNDFGFRTEANSTTGTPEELQGYAKQLEKVRKAYNSGALSESNFQIRIDAMSRRIRARYPGYDAEIDAVIGQTLNRSTANDLRRTLMQEWDAEKSAADKEESDLRTVINAARKDGILESAIPGYDLLVAKGKEPSKEETLYALSVAYGKRDAMQQEELRLKFLETKGKIAKQELEDTAYKAASVVTGQALASGLAGFDVDGLAAKLASKKPGDWSTQEAQEVIGAIAPLKLKMTTEMQKILANPVYATLDKATRDSIIARGMEPINAIEEAVLNKDVGLLKVFKTLSTHQGEMDAAKFTTLAGEKDAPQAVLARKYATMKTLFGDESAAMLLNTPDSTSGKTMMNEAILHMMRAEFADGQSLQGILETGKKANPNAVSGDVTKQVIKDAVTTLTNPATAQAGKEKMADLLFGAGNAEFLNQFSNAWNPTRAKSERMMVFEQLMSPSVTKAIAQAGAENPEVLEKYKTAMAGGFKALFKSDIDNVIDVSQFSDLVRIEFNPQTFRFEQKYLKDPNNLGVYAANSTTVGALYNLNEAWKMSSGLKSMNNVNRYLSLLKPAMEATGLDPEKALVELFVANGAIGGGKPEGSLFSQMGNAILGSLESAGKVQGAAIRDPKGFAKGLVDKYFSNDYAPDKRKVLRDFIGRAEGADYNTMFGGEKLPLTNMSINQAIKMGKWNRDVNKDKEYSSAIGRYQFTPDTLADAMKALGMTGDEIFDEATQDKLADWLIDNRASGGKDAKALAQIWASLPSDKAGKSYYDGVAGNKVTVTWDELQGVLQ